MASGNKRLNRLINHRRRQLNILFYIFRGINTNLALLEYRSRLMVSVVANIQIASALVLLTVPPSRGTLGTTILVVEARGEQGRRK